MYNKPSKPEDMSHLRSDRDKLLYAIEYPLRQMKYDLPEYDIFISESLMSEEKERRTKAFKEVSSMYIQQGWTSATFVTRNNKTSFKLKR